MHFRDFIRLIDSKLIMVVGALERTDNAAGEVGATALDIRLAPIWARAFALIGCPAGAVTHLADERRAPLAQKLWSLVLAQNNSAAVPQKTGQP